MTARKYQVVIVAEVLPRVPRAVILKAAAPVIPVKDVRLRPTPAVKQTAAHIVVVGCARHQLRQTRLSMVKVAPREPTPAVKQTAAHTTVAVFAPHQLRQTLLTTVKDVPLPRMLVGKQIPAH